MKGKETKLNATLVHVFTISDISYSERTSMVFNNIAHDEGLDFLDPLRHFKEENDIEPGDRSTLSSLLPRQSHSVQNEVHRLSFVNDHDPSQPPIAITLSVDASPGCGGIAWPAGQVSFRIPLMNIFSLNLDIHRGAIQLPCP
jgi:hypothetical protein